MPPTRTSGRRPATLQVSIVGRASGRVAAGLDRWLPGAAPRAARGELAIALVSDARMRALNRTYRGVDAATDVLSFQAAARDGTRGLRTRNRRTSHQIPGPGIPAPGPYLGDVAIALGVARAQAKALGHPLATELRILALHGLLHLLGYDHERDRGTMRRLEDRLRRRAGLPAGLIGRAPRTSR